MFKKSDQFILLAVAISFAVSGFLWFSGQREEGLFTAVWVPSILCFGIYFKLATLERTKKMSTTILLGVAFAVFTLMMTGLALTMREFQQMEDPQSRKGSDIN